MMGDPVLSAISLKSAKKGFRGAVGTLDKTIQSHPFKSAVRAGDKAIPNPGITGKGKLFSNKDKDILPKKNLVKR